MDAFAKPRRHELEDEYQPEGIDKRILQIKAIRKNRLQRVEREKKQALEDLKKAYDELADKRADSAKQMLAYAILDPVLEIYHLGDDIYMNNLRRWMDETQALKPKVQELHKIHLNFINHCFEAKKHLDDKTKEAKVLLLQTEKFTLLEETWDDFK